MKSIAEMIPEYETNLEALRARRLDLLAQREREPSFKQRHQLTVRIVMINEIIASTTAALAAMVHYAGENHG